MRERMSCFYLHTEAYSIRVGLNKVEFFGHKQIHKYSTYLIIQEATVRQDP